MNTNIRVENNKIIFDGHASNIEQCNVITNICNALNSSNNFKTIKYENGYAEFEILNQASDLKFAAAPSSLTFVFDSGVDNVDGITTSGSTIDTEFNDGESTTYKIVPKKLYSVVSVSANLDGGVMSPYVTGSNEIYITANAGGIGGTITIATRKDTRIVKPKVKNADGTYDNLIMESANNSYNSVVKPDGSFGQIAENSSGNLSYGKHIIQEKTVLWESSTPVSGSGKTISFSEPLKKGDIVEIYWGIDHWTTTHICTRCQYTGSSGNVIDRYSTVGKQLGVFYDRNWECNFSISANGLTINTGMQLWYSIPTASSSATSGTQGGTITLNTCSTDTDAQVYAVYKYS